MGVDPTHGPLRGARRPADERARPRPGGHECRLQLYVWTSLVPNMEWQVAVLCETKPVANVLDLLRYYGRMSLAGTRGSYHATMESVVQRLRKLGAKNVLIRAAEQGFITKLGCGMPECLSPEELGGRGYFEPVGSELSDWMPTHEHFPRSKREGVTVEWITRSWRTGSATGSITPRAFRGPTRRISREWRQLGCER